MTEKRNSRNGIAREGGCLYLPFTPPYKERRGNDKRHEMARLQRQKRKAKTLDPRLRLSRMTEGEVGDDRMIGLRKHRLQLGRALDDFSFGVDRDEGG